MDINQKSTDNLLIVCPNETKVKLLTEINKTNKLYNIKFMTKEEFKANYYYAYNDKACLYLMSKYGYKIDVAKVYLQNLYVIDINKTYKDKKLTFLSKLKKELIDNNLLEENKLFKKYLKSKQIIVKNYYDLDLYEEKMLNTKLSFSLLPVKKQVVECKSLEEEVNYVCLKIIELLNKNIDINKIYLTNVTDDYLYTINKLFGYYKIPINIDLKHSIYGTKVVKDYLSTNKLDLSNESFSQINSKLISIISDLSFLDPSDKLYKTLLIDKIKNTYISPKKKINAVNIKDLYNETFTSDEHVFVLGLNQDNLPSIYKDTTYISDSMKDEVSLYKTTYLNKRSKEALAQVFNSIDNLYLSYKLSSPFNTYYKSSIISDLSLEIIKAPTDLYNKSNIYNCLRLGEKLDHYYLYGISTPYLNELNTTYNIPYKTYSNSFMGINSDLYLKTLPYPLNLSYTSLNSYSECNFKYYIRHVLKLEPFLDTFSGFIGTLYHHILSLYLKTDFNFETEYNNYMSDKTLSLKEKLLLTKIKKDLQKLIETLKQKQLLTGYDKAYYEKKIEIPIRQDISVVFKGFIDKIMYYSNIEDTYFSIIDYKTGAIDTHIEPMKYGLHMQLPVYLYLIHYSKVFKNPIFTGIYYQNILFNYPTYTGKDIQKEYEDKLMLQGYSIDDPTILERFDTTYTKSEYIKSMSYTEEKGFGTYSKVMSSNEVYDLVKYTKNYIDKTTDNILNAKFDINPKIYDGKNVSCEFCAFKDLCWQTPKDLIYLDKVEDLSFLGGE